MQLFKVIEKKCGPLLARLWRWEFWQRVPLRLAIRYVNPEDVLWTPPLRFRSRPLRSATCIAQLARTHKKQPGRHLTVEDLCKVLDHLPSPPASLILTGIGEPLLNPQFFALVDILAAQRIQCVFYTNGTLLTPQIRQAIREAQHCRRS